MNKSRSYKYTPEGKQLIATLSTPLGNSNNIVSLAVIVLTDIMCKCPFRLQPILFCSLLDQRKLMSMVRKPQFILRAAVFSVFEAPITQITDNSSVYSPAREGLKNETD